MSAYILTYLYIFLKKNLIDVLTFKDFFFYLFHVHTLFDTDRPLAGPDKLCLGDEDWPCLKHTDVHISDYVSICVSR